MLRDMNQAMQVLLAVKHWTIKCLNLPHGRRHECTIWNAGRRVTASGKSPVDAVNAAIDKLADRNVKTPHTKTTEQATSEIDNDESIDSMILPFPTTNK